MLQKTLSLRIVAVICVLAMAFPPAAFAEEVDSPPEEQQTEQTESQTEEEATEEENTEETEDESLVVVDTGDAEGVTDVTNQANVTHTEVSDEGVGEDESEDFPEEQSSEQGEEEAEESAQVQEEEQTTESNSEEDEEEFEGTAAVNEGNSSNGTSTNIAEVDADTSVTVEQDLDADVDNNSTSTGTTGDNEVEENDGDVIVYTGDATFITNILNIINLNIVGINAMTTAVNIVGSIVDNLDFSRFHSEEEVADAVEEHDEFQQFVAENIGNEGDTNIAEVEVDNSVNVTTTSTAKVSNDVVLEAKTGNNTVKQNGSVMVRTGDVFLASNITNIVNTTVIGDGFTLAVINIVGSQFGGNIILPSLTADKIQDTEVLQGQCDQCGAGAEALNSNNEDTELNVAEVEVDNSFTVDVDQDADVDNNVSIIVDTGDNEIDDNDGDVTVLTGDAVALSQVLDYVNTSIIANNYVYGVVNVMNGAWNGNIWGIPQDGFVIEDHGSYITFKNTPKSLTLYSNDFDGSDSFARAENSGNESGTNKTHTIINNDTGVVTVQDAEIDNNVTIEGSTGENTVSDNDGDVYLETGNVFALSNIFNMANTSVVGNDVVFAYINIIGGEWNGDINFGMPDLHIMEVATPVDEQARPGGFVDYTIIVTNKGDADATNVAVEAQTDPGMVAVDIADNASVDENGLITWVVPELKIGEMMTFYYRAQIHDTAQNQEVVENHAFTYAAEDDRNLDDNVAETYVIVFGKPGPNIAGFGFPITFDSPQYGYVEEEGQRPQVAYDNPIDSDDIIVTQTNDTKGLIGKGQTVTFTLLVENTKDESFYDVMVWDELIDPDGNTVAFQSWDLGEVLPLEKIEIVYTVQFADDSAPGSYINSVWADGFNWYDDYLIFPEKKDALVIRDDFDATNVSVGIEYSYPETKYVGVENEESIVITNNGSQGISTGVVVIKHDTEYLRINDKEVEGFAVAVPGLQPGESHVVPLSVLPLKITDRTSVQLEYILESTAVSGLSSFHSIVPEPVRAVIQEAVASDQETSATAETSGDTDHIAALSGITPQVLGYEEVVASDNESSMTVWLRNTLWLVVWFGILILLFALKRRKDSEERA